jgi:hypothetical protein
LLWGLAVLVMLGAAVFQRTTGPTYPLRGVVELDGGSVHYELVRTEVTTRDARIGIPDPGSGVSGELVYRRYPTDQELHRVAMQRGDGALFALLPRQPAAGKVEYHLELVTAAGKVRVPAAEAGDPILRYRDPVPAAALVPHVLLMFLAILVGVRAGLGAALGAPAFRRHAWTALGLVSVGGMMLGPVVQKHAFGAYWTGFPFGYDLTDNKTLIMWLVWAAACGVLGLGPATDGRRAHLGRGAVLLAALVMMAVYLVPHSLRGSELDYDQLERGVTPAEAIRTGR